MKKIIGVIIVFIVVIFIYTFNILNKNMFKYSNTNDKVIGNFTAKTSSEILTNDKNNICYSPVSAISALILSSQFVEDDAITEICEVFDVNDVKELSELYGYIQKQVKVSEKTELKLCNSLWIDKDIVKTDSNELIDNCRKKLNCEIFENEDVLGSDINSWILRKTNGLIEGVADKNEEYPLFLANALYYRSNWEKNFANVGNDDFYLDDGKKIQTPYIKCSKQTMRYMETDQYTMVKVGLEDGDLCLVLPNDNKKLTDMLTEDKLNEFMALSSNDKMDRGVVTISIPEFTYEYESGSMLETVVKKVGINKVFNSDYWILGDETEADNVRIGQKSKIVLNKDGIEAATSTMVEVAYIGKSKDKEVDLEITFDRPFLYILMKDGVPLFIGTVYNPAE